MADIADVAAELEQADRDRALAVQAQSSQAMLGGWPGRTHCADCDGPIEPERLRALPRTGRCAECAHDAEKRLRGSACRT